MRILKYILSTALLFIGTSCEDVIDLELDDAPPRLVIDASLNWQKGTTGQDQVIKLSLTAPFFDNTIPPATGATVHVTDSNNNTFNFIEEDNTGIYKNESFIPEINGIYNLNITYNDELYTATETLMPVVPIESVEQKNDGGFSGEDIELKAYYTDPLGIENYYLFEFNIVKFRSTYLEVYDDEFTDGSRIFAFYSNDDMQLVNEVLITAHGISERTYEFYNILLQQTDENNGDPIKNKPLTIWEQKFNKLIGRTRFKVERTFGGIKRWFNGGTARYRLRISSFHRLGQDELNVYENDQAVIFNEDFQIYEKAEPIGTESFKRSDVIESFYNLEPRASLAYQLNPVSSVKLSYNRMSQYLHLLSNTNSPTPLDIWTPSGKYVKPQLLDQYAIGYFKNFKDNKYSLEVESFYKDIKNRIDYIDGADLIANNAIEQVILNGKARAYGLELLLRKNDGRFKGWLAYTLSKSEQQTPGRTSTEIGINNGNWYNAPYDKTHDISFTGSYDWNEKWKINTNFIFQTGQPATFPNGQYEFNGLVIPNYSNRNSDRLPAYHRLDLSLNYTPKPYKKDGMKSNWIFGIYNIYNRRNAASITFGQNETTGFNEATRLSIFGIVPSISYNFKF